jgi:DNA topoisomerase IB
VRRGRGFAYRHADGSLVEDRETLERLRELAIPPAWSEVWICADPRGHLQATGVDAAGRKQYLYHPVWRSRRDREKFDRMLEFAAALPALRRRVTRDLSLPRFPKQKVVACAVRLLDLGFFRIGGEDYAQDNGTFGLATLQREHVTLAPGPTLVFDFPAKGGARRRQSVTDRAAYEVVSALKRRRTGSELLAFRDGGAWRDVRSSDINDYIRDAGEFSAKDFRTWNATVLAAVSLAVLGQGGSGSPTARKRIVSLAVGEVAHYLGNTPAVCRASYIDPRVIDRFHAGVTVRAVIGKLGGPPDDRAAQRVIEAAVLELLSDRVPDGSAKGQSPRHTAPSRSAPDGARHRFSRRAAREPLPTKRARRATMPDKRPSVKNEKQYEALKKKGMSKERAARIANSPDASSRGGKSASRSSSSQGGTTAQKKAAGRKGGKATARKKS